MNIADVSIHILNDDSLIIDPFDEFVFSFEIVNNTDEQLQISSKDDIIISLKGKTDVIYKMSMSLPVTSEMMLELMREKRRYTPPDPIVIEPGKKFRFNFNSYNTLPFIKNTFVDLTVNITIPDTTVIQSRICPLKIINFSVLDSNNLLLDDTTNVYMNSMSIDTDNQKKILVYYSEYPVFDKIKTYHQYDYYPNYESIYAVFPWEKGIKKALPVLATHSYNKELHVSFLFDSKVKIVSIAPNCFEIARSYKQVLISNFNMALYIEKIKQYTIKHSLIFLIMTNNGIEKQLFFIQKKLTTWQVSPVKQKIDLNKVRFEDIVPNMFMR